VHRTDFLEDQDMLLKADLEILTDLLAPIHLCKYFLPLLANHPHAEIINITAGLVYAPKASYPIYNSAISEMASIICSNRCLSPILPFINKLFVFIYKR